MTSLISLTVFLVLFLLCVGIYRVVRGYQAKRILKEKIDAGSEDWVYPEQEKTLVRNKFFDFLKAGIRKANVIYIFWGTKILLAVCLPIAFFLSRVTFFKVLNPSRALAVCIFLAVVGLYLPHLWLRLKIAKRKNKIFEGIPDALDLMVVCVEAGMGLDSAMNRVGEEMSLSNKPLSDEFKLYNLEMRAGTSRKEALRNLAMRTDLEEVRSLVTLLIQADKFGTSIAQSLRVYSDSFRTKRFQRAEELAATLPVKLIFPLILFIVPAFFVVLVGPAAISLYRGFVQQ